jgi:transposase
LTQLQIGEWIESNFGKRFTQAGVSVLFKRLKIKLKTGRPSNVRKDEAAAEDFKKTSLKP